MALSSIEHHTTIEYITRFGSDGISGDAVLALCLAHPEVLLNFHGYFNDAASAYYSDTPHRREMRISGIKNLFSTKSPYSTATAVDTIFQSEDMEILGKPRRLLTFGISFLKPDRLYSADLIAITPGKLRVAADGASLVAKKEDPEFPPQLKEIYTFKDMFMPDVFWTTSLAWLIDKTAFHSPFWPIINQICESSLVLTDLKKQICQTSDPKNFIDNVNQAMGQILHQLCTSSPLIKTNNIFYPSGVISVINPEKLKHASTGDIRSGVSAYPGGNVKIFDKSYKTVSEHDQAVSGMDQKHKNAIASARVFEVGNLQGEPVSIRQNDIPYPNTKPDSKGCLVQWTDGEDLQFIFPSQKNLFTVPHLLKTAVPTPDNRLLKLVQAECSLAGTLIARDPLVYQLYLLHYQTVYTASFQRELKYLQQTGKESQLYKRMTKQPKWRSDEASMLITYFTLL